jgi:hypothetical protein
MTWEQLLENLPDPDLIGQSEYRAVHELLFSVDGPSPEGDPVTLACGVLAEVRDWADCCERLVREMAP